MQVVHVTPAMFGNEGLFGGGERYPLELAKAMAAEVPTRLVGYGPRSMRARHKGLEVVVLPRWFSLRGHPAHPIGPGLARCIRTAGVVHTHQTASAPACAAALSARARRIPVVTTDHGLGRGLWGPLLRKTFDGFLTVSRHSAAMLGAPAEKTCVLLGGADPQRFRPDPAAGRDGVLFVGRLTPHKGVDNLIRAMPEGELLRICGTGGHDPHPPERDYPQVLRALAARKRVEFLCRVADEDLPTLYRSARVFVLPSVEVTCYGRRHAISELLGLAVIEAMASGTPVVCSNIGGIPEIVRDGETGFLVPPGDAAALGDAVRRLLTDDRVAQRMGEAAREHAVTMLTWQACARRCLDAYDQMIPR
ncbi:MAG TPA: glycosyltransferase family 4 protein [Actinomycetota bacterium]|nr:glycosyltransferase family 4 protein [Actinomycetota bacterium]